MSPSASDWAHLSAFVHAFIPKRRQPRWLAILAAEPKKWSVLSMDDAFDSVGPMSPGRMVNIDDVLGGKENVVGPTYEAVMFRLSSMAGVSHGTIADLADAISLDDAVISVVPGKVALASHHSGDWALFSKR
jgi:hypothetical protein